MTNSENLKARLTKKTLTKPLISNTLSRGSKWTNLLPASLCVYIQLLGYQGSFRFRWIPGFSKPAAAWTCEIICYSRRTSSYGPDPHLEIRQIPAMTSKYHSKMWIKISTVLEAKDGASLNQWNIRFSCKIAKSNKFPTPPTLKTQPRLYAQAIQLITSL